MMWAHEPFEGAGIPIMRRWLVLALVVLLAMPPAYADTSKCWGMANDLSHPELSCTPLTQDLLTGLEGASKARVIQAMGASGSLDEGGALSFESNFRFRQHGFSGSVSFTFNRNNRVVVIAAAIDAPHHRRGVRYVWNAGMPGCSDFPGSIQRCDNVKGVPRPLEKDFPPHPAPSHHWLPAWLRWHFFLIEPEDGG